MVQREVGVGKYLAKCDNCERLSEFSDVSSISDMQTRIEPGGIVPVGQCSECGSLCYLLKFKHRGKMGRCAKFIAEFNKDACEALDLTGFRVVSHALNVQSGENVVRMYYKLENKDIGEELMMDQIIYCPEEDDEEVVERVTEMFGLDAATAKRRLKKAHLNER